MPKAKQPKQVEKKAEVEKVFRVGIPEAVMAFVQEKLKCGRIKAHEVVKDAMMPAFEDMIRRRRVGVTADGKVVFMPEVAAEGVLKEDPGSVEFPADAGEWRTY